MNDEGRKAKTKARWQAWYDRNRQRILEKAKANYLANADKIKAKSAQWYKDNHERALESNRQRRLANPEQTAATVKASIAKKPEYYRQNKRDYYLKNKELIVERSREYRKQWRKDNKERIAAVNRAYYEAHREEYQARFREAYARKRNAPGKHTAKEVRDLWIEQGRKCAVPGCTHPISDRKGENRYHVDHIRALARGGSNDKSNLQILCAQHNWEKNDRDEYEWAVEHGVLLS